MSELIQTSAPSIKGKARTRKTVSNIKRIGISISGLLLVVWGVVTASFILISLIPGDPALAIIGGGDAAISEETLDEVRRTHGLDQPVAQQYLAYIGRIITGDFGESYALRESVLSVLTRQLGPTLVLSGLALTIAVVLAVGVATLSVRLKRGGDVVINFLEVTAAAMPHFWLGALLITGLAVNLQIFSATSSTNSLRDLFLPAFTLSVPLAGFMAQLMRESLLDSHSAPFAEAARGRGEAEFGITARHALRHSLVPLVNLSGWAFGSLISGAVVVESIFAREGIGRTLLNAVLARDIPLVTGGLILIAVIYVLVNIVSELLIIKIDPRIIGEGAA